jgi:DNA-binding transcriptional regulator YbjK
VNNAKLHPDERRAVIVSAAVNLANERGLSEVTFRSVAEQCRMPCEPRTVQHYFKIGELRCEVAADSRAHQSVRDDAVAMGINV